TEEAEGYRQRVVASAEGEASRFSQVLKEYAKAPAVTRERMYLDTMQQIFSNTTKVMVDARENGNLLFLPLDKLMQMSSSDITGMNSSAKPSPTETAPVPDSSRSRDSLLNRDRGPRHSGRADCMKNTIE